ncbi:uncharacterized protein LOC139918632 [Centroberyx gerrardi]
MMESCLAGKPERVGPVKVDDIRRDLLSDFSALPTQESVQSQTENLQVYLRIRPFTASESDSGESQDCVTMEGSDTVVLKAPRSCQSNRKSDKPLPQTAQRFTFTQVFGPDSSQRKVFDGSVRGLVRNVLEGGNCLVFTYGVTNAGKTFTFLGPEHDSGLLPRSLSVIFNSIDGRVYSGSDLKPQRCRDFSRLTPDQQVQESSSKRQLLRLLKESDREAELRLLLESQIREEVSAEFMELFNQMEKDYSDRLEKERELLETRAEKRLEILKNLVNNTMDLSNNTDDSKVLSERSALLEGILSSVTEDLQKIREDAQTAQRCLTQHTHTAELEALRLEKQQSHDQLQEAKESLEQQRQQLSDQLGVCQQKDDIISKLQGAMDRAVEDTSRDRVLVESIRKELMELQQNCRCLKTGGEKEEKEEGRKRQSDALEEEGGGPARKRVVLEEEIWRLQEENDRKEETICQLRGETEERRRREEEERGRREEERRSRQEEVEEERRSRQEEVEQLKKEQEFLEQKVTAVMAAQCPYCDSLSCSLESEQKETTRLTKENKALINGIFQLQTEVTGLQQQLREQTDRADSLSEQLDTTKARLQNLESQSEEKTKTVDGLTQEVKRLTQEADGLRQEVKEEAGHSSSVFHAAMAELRKESEAALERSALKTQQIENLQRDKTQLEKTLMDSESVCVQLREELANQRAEFSSRLQIWQTDRKRLEEMERAEEEKKREVEREKEELRGALSEQQNLLEDRLKQMEALSQELASLREADLQRRKEEEEERKVPVVEELKEEMQRLQEKREREREGRQEEEEREQRSRGSRQFEAVRREMERLKTQQEEQENTQEVSVSPLQSNMADRTKTPRTTRRKRKSNDVEDLVHSENKRNRLRGNKQVKSSSSSSSVVKEKKDGTLQKIGDLLHSSPSILGSKAKTIIGLVSGRSVEKEAVTVTTKPKRGRRKLYKTDVSCPLLDSPHLLMGGAEEEKESDHLIIRRQLRSKTSRK